MGRLTPTKRQLEFQDWEFGILIHFGIRTYYDGHRDFDREPMDPARFNPTKLDCRQWARIARDAGARYMIMTTKHHDGFANWPSRFTKNSVAASRWKNGRGDVVREYVGACRKAGLKVGLYYSPADFTMDDYESNPGAYNKYVTNQLTELMSNYGKIDVLWLDGFGSEKHDFKWPRIMKRIRSLQPDIAIFEIGDLDYRWVGNEAGIAPIDSHNVGNIINFSAQAMEKLRLKKPRWLPVECDTTVRESGWFFSDAKLQAVRSYDELAGLYYYSVGRGCNLLLNVSPDCRGLFPGKDSRALLRLGNWIRQSFSHPVATTDCFSRKKNAWSCKLEKPVLVDHMVIRESLNRGESIERFRISVHSPRGYSGPQCVYEGYTVGHKAICRFPAIRAQEVILEVVEARSPVRLRSIELFHVQASG